MDWRVAIIYNDITEGDADKLNEIVWEFALIYYMVTMKQKPHKEKEN